MKHARSVRASVVASMLAVAMVSGAACGADDGGGAAPSVGKEGAKTGPGVTDDTITVGALTDLTGPYAPLGMRLVDGQQLYVDQVNESGGICGRQLGVEVRDHGYDVRKGVAAYTDLAPDVAVFTQLLGSPIMAELLDDLDRDQILTYPQAWASTLLGHPQIQVVGTTYDIDMINGIDFLVRTGKVGRGDKIGHIYFDNEYGKNAFAGAKFATARAGLEIFEQKVNPTDEDMTAQVSAMKSAGVRAVLISVGPAQAASAVGVASTQGLSVPILTSRPGFLRYLIRGQLGLFSEQNLYVVSSLPAPSADIPGMVELVARFKEKYPDKDLEVSALAGYVAAATAGEDLKEACRRNDLSRSGMVAAHRSLNSGDLGLGLVQDFSDSTKPSSYKSYILKAKRNEPSGLVTEEQAFEAPAVREYSLPG